MRTEITRRTIANECLRLLVNEMAQKDLSAFAGLERQTLPSLPIGVDCGADVACDSDSRSSLLLRTGHDIMTNALGCRVSVTTKARRGLIVDFIVPYLAMGEPLDRMAQQYLAPQMAYLAHLLVPSRMPSDAPDYVYMGV